MAEIIVGKQNTLTYTWSVTAGVGTLVVTGETAFDLGLTDLIRVVDTTNANATFGINANTTFSNTFVNGIPTYTWVIPNVPTGTLTASVLLVYLNMTYAQIQILLLQYQKA